jgi:hypothetical protein
MGHSTSPELMTKDQYHFECRRRSPRFRLDVLTLHQAFPPIFVPAPRGRPRGEVEEDVRRSEWRDRIYHLPRRGFVYRPRTWDDLEQTRAVESFFTLCRWDLLGPPDDAAYFAILGPGSEARWRRAVAVLRRHWPDVHPDVLRLPWVVADQPRASIAALDGRYEPPAGALAAMFAYEDTTREDLIAQIPALLALKRRLIAPARGQRTRPRVLAQRIRIWDTYEQLRDLQATARVLGLPRSTVSRLYQQAHKDILGRRPAGSSRARRSATVDRTRHLNTCQQCSGATAVEAMCPSGRAYVEQDQHAGRRVIG